MKIYVDEGFYIDEYLLGRERKIQSDDFKYWAMIATGEIKKLTFGRVDEMEEIPEEVMMCCCEIAERMHEVESAKEDNGMILQSYGNDGETGTYKTDDMSESELRKSIVRIARKWLSCTGLLYCGVRG